MARGISGQVAVITGATSGIGRVTARRFSEEGAAVVLAARDRERLEELAAELPGEAVAVPTDVAEWEQVDALARAAVERFGRIDTWVNGAAVSVYGTVAELTPEQIDRVLRTDLHGQIWGMKAAADVMRRQGAGAIINISSVLGRRGAPLQAPYSAAKHGIIGFADALRLELAREGLAVSVTTVLPASIDTPFFDNAGSEMGVKPMPLPPVYPPAVVAEAILAAARAPRREIVVGGAAKVVDLAQRLSPPVVDWLMLGPADAFSSQRTDEPAEDRDAVDEPRPDTAHERGSFSDMTRGTSLYTRLVEIAPNRVRSAVANVLSAAGAVSWSPSDRGRGD